MQDIVGVDVGFDNPIFACLEIDYEDVDEDPTGEARQLLTQSLTFYELDLGLNHVVRKESLPLDGFANKLIAVPGGSDGPGGVCTTPSPPPPLLMDVFLFPFGGTFLHLLT